MFGHKYTNKYHHKSLHTKKFKRKYRPNEEWSIIFFQNYIRTFINIKLIIPSSNRVRGFTTTFKNNVIHDGS